MMNECVVRIKNAAYLRVKEMRKEDIRPSNIQSKIHICLYNSCTYSKEKNKYADLQKQLISL